MLRGVETDPAIDAALTTLRRRRQEIDDAIRALERIGGGSTADQKPNRTAAKETAGGDRAPGRGARTDAVEEVLMETPGRGLTPEQLAQALKHRGVPLRSDNPARAARAAGNRARQRNPRITLRDGRFVYLGSEVMPSDLFQADGGDSS